MFKTLFCVLHSESVGGYNQFSVRNLKDTFVLVHEIEIEFQIVPIRICGLYDY